MTFGYPKALQDLSDRLLGLSTEALEAGIQDSLADLGRLTGAERVYVSLLSSDSAQLDRAFEWCDRGVPGHDFTHLRGEALHIGAYVNVPLWMKDRLVGWLGFDTDEPDPGWAEDDIALMRAAGRMLIFTIDRIEREHVLRTEQALSRRLS